MTVSAPAHALDFGDPAALDAGMSAMARGLRGSVILQIAAEVRELAAAGRPLCNLTVGDFDPKQFPVPTPLREFLVRALEAGETNYPPSDGMLPLRQAVVEYVAREHGVALPLTSVLISAGGRPAIYAAYRCLLDAGEAVLFSVPSWNNDYYAGMVGARELAVRARAEQRFQPTLAELEPHLPAAKLLCLCSPGNPTGTLLQPETLRSILEAVVQENERRASTRRTPLFVLHDLMYGSLVFGGVAHAHPLALVPEAAPWVVTVDGISKAFAGTGLRVGWVTAAPGVIGRMKDFLGHVGAWAPRPEQLATAQFLRDPEAIAEFRRGMNQALSQRLEALHTGFTALKAKGLPVNCVRAQGAMYLSLQLDLAGRSIGGVTLADNEAIRKLLLERAGLAAVPFQAFGLQEESGWFRLSVGAVSLEEIAAVLPRVEALLELVGGRSQVADRL
ncbi:MAG TPA: aminotransferase class I/II-fold pyridoxal phosphate-dependent enzyme [Gemmatimonadales bacterium]|nr:aminotransferase class I/II-fold pyridoxal phosphate-dependent enzyme [Gemmatimonadales bacterium]